MKKLLLFVFITFTTTLFAQNFITNPSDLTKEIAECIRKNDKACLQKYIVTVEDLKLVIGIAANYANEDHKVTRKEMDDTEKEIMRKVSSDVNSLFASIKRKNIDLNNAVITNENMEIIGKKEFPQGCDAAEGEIKFSLPNVVYKIEYSYFFNKTTWKLIGIDDKLTKYSVKKKLATKKPSGTKKRTIQIAG